MANIKVKIDYPIKDGTGFTFHAPCDCSSVEGIAVEHPGGTQRFCFKDAHGNDLTGINNLFVAGSLVKVVLDVTHGAAFIQNADTNGYMEQRITSVRNEIAAERARIDQFNALEEGSTTGDAELMDLRVDYKGRTWANAGAAVRGVTQEIGDAFDIDECANLLNPDEVVHETEASSGGDSGELDWDDENDTWRSGYISVSSGDTLTVQYKDPTTCERVLGTINSIYCYGSDKTEVDSIIVNATEGAVPAGCFYVRLWYTLPVDAVEVAVVKGTEIVPFEEYRAPIRTLKPEYLPEGVNTDGGGYGGIFGLSVTDDGNGNVTVDAGDDIPAVLFTEQKLTDEQKVQTRENIGIIVDDELSDTSTNPVQNKAVAQRMQDLIVGLTTALGVARSAESAAATAQQTANTTGALAQSTQGRLDYEVDPKIAALETTVQEQGVLIVTLDGDGHADCDIQRIWTHANNGGTVLLQITEYWYVPLSCVCQEFAYFSYVADDLTLCQWTITGQGDVAIVEDYGLASFGAVANLETRVNDTIDLVDDFNADIADNRHSITALENQVGDIDTALDSIIAIQESLIGGDSE